MAMVYFFTSRARGRFQKRSVGSFFNVSPGFIMVESSWQNAAAERIMARKKTICFLIMCKNSFFKSVNPVVLP